ncbi:MAG TPA: biopolymer transporter ExbD [Verrucomicrobiae bacterium]|nr:biopolymer transporter ExbD [Verrucomicrobiae bacterium]
MTLNDINITPLLDLAFVLLIIFIITTPLLEQSLKLNLPTGGAESTTRKDQIRTIEVNPKGGYVIKGHPYSLEQLEALLAADFQRDPQLGIAVRADDVEHWGNVARALDICRKLGIKKVGFQTFPPKR